ncbi:methionyl-tRNA formyltransferase [Betaproteobacteria bacterium SCN2]|jgi:methionyl-tRNA formyltransferase|nr:methionyl-tRNA formyltransferase [Betaproteobacteria bacterium SCN2]
MRLIFAGTPEFARAALAAIADAGHEVALVLTQPDRPSGRGMKLTPSPVKQEAEKRGLPVFQPASLRDPASHEAVKSAGAEVMVVAAYGLILPQAVLDIPARGCLNIHASLLPRWRGAAPIQRAIEAGDSETGICIMQMEAGLDTGPVLLEKRLPILDSDTGASLHDKLAALGAAAIVEALARLGALEPVPQPQAGVTYASKLSREEAQLDWTLPAEVLARRIRAFNPVPGAWTLLNGESLKIWQAEVVPGKGRPGEVLQAAAGQLVVACGTGALRLRELQKPGTRRMDATAFLAGGQIAAGASLGN